MSADSDVPERTLNARFEEIAAEFPHNPALHFIGLKLTYKELMAHADRFAQALISNGCAPGDHFTLAQQPELDAFTHYRPWRFTRPTRQVVADYVTRGGIVTVAILALVAAAWRPLSRIRASGPTRSG